MKTVLIADEDVFTRNVFAQTLSSRGFTVFHADSSRAALDVLRQDRVDLVVVDATLSDADGASFVRAVRAFDKKCRVVMLSSVFRADPSEYESVIEQLDVSLVLHKPISPVEFCAQIETIFDLSQELQWIPNAGDGISEAEHVRLSYRQTVEADLVELERKVERLAQGEQQFATARASASLLRATASRHGFFAVSRASARLEAALTRIETRGPDAGAWAEVRDAVDDAYFAARTPAGSEGGIPATVSVLVVDDDLETLHNYEKFGREALIHVVTAQTADEVIDRIRDPEIRALLVDVDLGKDRDAFEFVRTLRERSTAQRLPLGFLADRGTLPDRVMAAHLGASVFVEKPRDASQFADVVQRLVASQHQGRNPRVVVVDRDLAFVGEVSEMLAHANMEPHHIESSAELIERLDELAPDGLIVSVSMPGIGGFDLCRMVRAMPRWHDLPILLVGDRMDPRTRIAAFRSGADDYLSKPPIREELLARLQVRIERLRLLREQASVDLLTGLLNRRPFLQRINTRIAEATRSGQPLALALLDLDSFKEVNDVHGHTTGDRVLAAFGRLLTNRFRLEDLRGRWGGEEFIVALIGEEAATAVRVLERTAAEFSEMEFVGEDHQRFKVTFSAGVAMFPQDGRAFRELLSVADRRLYLAKARGKNCVIATDHETS